MTREEAIRIIRETYHTDEEMKALESLIPELRESEDERIRKAIIELLKEVEEDETYTGRQHIPDMLSYLEKQKERGPLTKEEEYTLQRIIEYLEDETCPPEWISLLHDIYCLPYEKQKEQKPAEWSEEDEDMLNSCISSIEEAKENRYAYKETDGDTSYDHEIAWLKSLRPSWKPSEEHLSALLAIFNDPDNIGSQTCQLALTDLYEQLKKL